MTSPLDDAGTRRALIVLPADFIGGAERQAIGMAEAALQTGTFGHVDIFVLSKPPTGSLDRLSDLPGLRVIYARAFREYAAILALSLHLRHYRYDLVFATHTHVNALCCVLRRLRILRTKRLVTRESSSIFEVDIGWYKAIVPFLVRLYGSQDCLIHQTTYMMDSFNRHTRGRLSERCRVVPNSINLDRVRKGAAEPVSSADVRFRPGLNILWCGRMVAFKRPWLAMEAIGHLSRSTDLEFHFHVVGDGPLLARTRAAADAAGISGCTTWWGAVANPWAIMARCDLGLLSSDVEGFPNVALEMLACGVRYIVSTDCAGDLELVPGVRLVKSAEPADLASELLEAAHAAPPEGVEPFLQNRTPTAFLRAVDSVAGGPAINAEADR